MYLTYHLKGRHLGHYIIYTVLSESSWLPEGHTKDVLVLYLAGRNRICIENLQDLSSSMGQLHKNQGSVLLSAFSKSAECRYSFLSFKSFGHNSVTWRLKVDRVDYDVSS